MFWLPEASHTGKAGKGQAVLQWRNSMQDGVDFRLFYGYNIQDFAKK